MDIAERVWAMLKPLLFPETLTVPPIADTRIRLPPPDPEPDEVYA